MSSKFPFLNDPSGHDAFIAERTSHIKPQYGIVLIYLLMGIVWVMFSDALVFIVSDHFAEITLAQNLKGLFFVLVTGALLYLLISRAYRQVVSANHRLLASYEQTVRGWIRVMDQRHQETRHHSERVMQMCLALARLSGRFNDKELTLLKCGALLHDIGKIGIPDEILIKPAKLNPEEWALMQTHPLVARDILSDIEFLRPCIDIPYQHHEKWDGSGYPQGLKGEQIAYAARLFAIVDVWDAISHPRVYKEAWPEQDVLDYLQAESGKSFDPAVVRLFIDNFSYLKQQVAALED